eukprot:NODE_288_length_10680_cov_0.431245.p4 type:complete len:338 gc:universal NODE_288_length_10680_cov_0.431245:7343-6330(-)
MSRHNQVLEVSILLNNGSESLDLHWNGQELKVQSPKDSVVNVKLSESKVAQLPKLVSGTSSLKKTVLTSPRQAKINRVDQHNKKISPAKVQQSLNKPENLKKGKKRISRKKQGELAIQCIRHLYAAEKKCGVEDDLLCDVKLLFSKPKYMNEKALSDVGLMFMNAQTERFDKKSVKNEDWHLGNTRSKVSASDKKSRNILANKAPIHHGVFDVVYDENESNLEFVRYLFSPVIESDAFITDLKQIFVEKSYIDDGVLESISLLFDGKLNRLNLSAPTPLLKSKSQQAHIVHHFDIEEPKSKSATIKSNPVRMNKTMTSKVQIPHRSKNDAKTFQKNL